MAAGAVIAGALALLYAALFALACAQVPHGRALLRRKPTVRDERIARYVGWGALALSLALALDSGRPAIGVMTWLGAVPLLGGAIVLALTYRPAAARGGIAVATLVALAALFV